MKELVGMVRIQWLLCFFILLNPERLRSNTRGVSPPHALACVWCGNGCTCPFGRELKEPQYANGAKIPVGLQRVWSPLRTNGKIPIPKL